MKYTNPKLCNRDCRNLIKATINDFAIVLTELSESNKYTMPVKGNTKNLIGIRYGIELSIHNIPLRRGIDVMLSDVSAQLVGCREFGRCFIMLMR